MQTTFAVGSQSIDIHFVQVRITTQSNIKSANILSHITHKNYQIQINSVEYSLQKRRNDMCGDIINAYKQRRWKDNKINEHG